MTMLVRESDPHTIVSRKPFETGRDRRQQSSRTALLDAAHVGLSRHLSPDPVEFLELHRQRDGE
jgi:hypothetical protein